MIVCSCNVFSDQQVRSAVANAPQRQRMSQIYQGLGGTAQCGRCAHTIKLIMGQVAKRAYTCADASTNPACESARTMLSGRQDPASAHTIRQVNRSATA